MLEGENVKLVAIQESDIVTFGHWRNLGYIRRYTREFRPLTVLNQKRWFEQCRDDPSTIMFSIIVEDMLAGCCGLTYIDWKEGGAEVSIYMGSEKWEEGKEASETLRMLLSYGFCELRLHRIYRIVYAYNVDHISFLERNDFKLEGRHREARFLDGSYHDELVYGILAPEYFQSVGK